MTTPVLVAVAWPYASGSRHLGHLAGAYLPADIFARQQRMAGNEVLMVSGSDVHGTPITVRAEEDGVTPADIVDRYHSEFLRQWDELGMSWDLFTTTGTENHARATQEMFLAQRAEGHIDRRTSEQLFDPEKERFLPDRFVEGTCPYCDYPDARGDQCDNCGRTLDPTDLIDPRSKLSGARPVLRETEHFYFRYSDFADRLKTYLESRKGWRPHVLNFALGWLEEGLLDRAITRDIEWGVELPVDDLGPGKRIYVWYDAVIGYLSASWEWAESTGDPERWKHWWHNDDARHVYFIGKDNIPFHALFWPAQLMGVADRMDGGELRLPDDIPANQYVTFKGGKASASRASASPSTRGWSASSPTPSATPWPPPSRSRPTPRSPRSRSGLGSTRSWSPPGATWSTASCRWSTSTATAPSPPRARWSPTTRSSWPGSTGTSGARPSSSRPSSSGPPCGPGWTRPNRSTST